MRIAIFAATMLIAWAGLARAGAKERRDAYDAAVVAPLQEKDPSAAAMFQEAGKAYEAGELQRAVELYEKVSAAAPSFSPAIRRWGGILARMGRRDEGLVLARRAVALEPTRENRSGLSLVLANAPPGAKPDAASANEAVSLAKQAAEEAPNDVDQQQAYCQVMLMTATLGELSRCADRVVRLAPNEPEPHYYAALAAMARGDRDAARASMEEAQRRGANPKALEVLGHLMDATEPPLVKWGRRLAIVVAAWLFGLALLLGVGSVLSRKTLELSERLASARGESGEGAELRRVYRAVLHVASFYYYASLPLVLVLSVCVGGGVILGFLLIGHIPIYFVVVVATIVLYSIKSVVQSLIIRGRDEDPGIAVDLQKHHRLAAVLGEVAKRVGTRVVDEVYLTHDTQIAVLERGGFLRQARGKSERCLVLGVGVLDGMKLSSFKSVLAHEYGHFSNHDTAGGSVALAVRRSLLLTAVGLASGGAAAWYNPAWLFVLYFDKIFLRVSQGASRLQEVMADAIAASAYGPEAFANGLRHVVRRSVEFDAHLEATLQEVAGEARRPLNNIYRYEPRKRAAASDIEAEIAKQLEGQPCPYDSHPRPMDRIRWIQELRSSLPPSPTDATEAWGLFEEREAVELRMTRELRTQLVAKGVAVVGE